MRLINPTATNHYDLITGKPNIYYITVGKVLFVIFLGTKNGLKCVISPFFFHFLGFSQVPKNQPR